MAILENNNNNNKNPYIRNTNLEQLNEFITEKISSKFWEQFPADKI